MRFHEYYDPVSRRDKESRSTPVIGVLIVDGPFHASDANFYPNHEVFGVCEAGEYPLYGHFEFLRDSKTGDIVDSYLDYAFASIPGTSDDGKIGFHNPFHIYGYEVSKYLGEGKMRHGVRHRIVLDKPFYIDERSYGRSVAGYDMAWLKGGD